MALRRGHAGLLPWNLICPKATAAPLGVQAMWVSRRVYAGWSRDGMHEWQSGVVGSIRVSVQ